MHKYCGGEAPADCLAKRMPSRRHGEAFVQVRNNACQVPPHPHMPLCIHKACAPKHTCSTHTHALMLPSSVCCGVPWPQYDLDSCIAGHGGQRLPAR